MKDKVELDNVSLFFSSESNSASSSEKSSSSSLSSSSTTCFAAPRTKSVRRGSVSPRRSTPLYSCDNQPAEMKSKSRALQMYNNLKKVKQPISPGGRLTSFLSSIFNNKSNKLKQDVDERSSRSCLSKTPPKYGVKRTVRFNPVSVIVDEDCRPCGHKSIYDQHSDDLRRPKSQGSRTKVDYNYAEEDDDDASSCSSSDLFEIDHLAFFGDKRFCEELPVYETTHVSGLIR